jgi:putative transposase
VLYPHKNIRLPAAHYIGQRFYFATLCCSGRHSAFANRELAVWLIEELRKQAVSNQFAVHAYCVMPDHLHVLVCGVEPTSNMLAFLKKLKQKTSYEFQQRFHQPLWQKKFYDHILRPRDSLHGVATYIWMNPVRKRLCKHPHKYPFSGSFALDDWRKAFSPAELWQPPWKDQPS